MELRRLATILAIADALAVILAACSNGDDSAPTSVVPVGPTATAEPPDEVSKGTEIEPVVFEVGPCQMTMAAQLPIEFEYIRYDPHGIRRHQQGKLHVHKGGGDGHRNADRARHSYRGLHP